MVQADYLALANDLEQAQALASSLEIQLSGKTNELARFKSVWERAQADLVKFERDLDTMRRERHALANEVQKAYAVGHNYEKLKATHAELTARAEALEAELAGERKAHAQTRADLESALALVMAAPRAAAGGGARDSELRRMLEAIRVQIDLALGGSSHGGSAHVRTLPNPASEHIDIEFGA